MAEKTVNIILADGIRFSNVVINELHLVNTSMTFIPLHCGTNKEWRLDINRNMIISIEYVQ